MNWFLGFLLVLSLAVNVLLALVLADIRAEQKLKEEQRGYSAGDFRCSECGKPNPCWSLTEYCPNCGEHMKEGT